MDPVQAEIATVALAAAGHDFALAGGNALVEHGLLDRPTTDVDLFSPLPGGAGQVADQVRQALEQAGFTVDLVAGLQGGQADFARFRLTRDGASVMLDLARDWRADPPVQLSVGPVLHLDDAVASKVVAMLTRGLARDYIDVAAALGRYDRQHLLGLAYDRDPGLQPDDAYAAMQNLDWLPDAEFTPYGLTAQRIQILREQFRAWPRTSPSALPQPASQEHTPTLDPDRRRERSRDRSSDRPRRGRDDGGRSR